MNLLIVLVLLLNAGCAYEVRSTTTHPIANPTAGLLTYKPKNVWSFRLISAEIPPRKRSGLDWDSDNTKPDPFVRLYVDGRKVWESPVVYDTTSPQWNLPLPRNVEVGPNSLFQIELWDFDTIASADPVGKLTRQGLPVTLTPNAVTRLMLDTGSVITVMIDEPRIHEGVGIRSYETRPDCLLVSEVEPYSPAGRAGIKPNECIVAISGQRVSDLEDIKAMTMLSLASKRGYPIKVTDKNQVERTIKLDSGYIWLTM
jgi:hypothetical protein